MVRTVVTLEDDVYKMLVDEAIKRYGSARKISKVLNEILREYLGKKKRKFIFSETIRVKKKVLSLDEIEKKIIEGILEAVDYGGNN